MLENREPFHQNKSCFQKKKKKKTRKIFKNKNCLIKHQTKNCFVKPKTVSSKRKLSQNKPSTVSKKQELFHQKENCLNKRALP